MKSENIISQKNFNQLLDELYIDAKKRRSEFKKTESHLGSSSKDHFEALKNQYMQVDRNFGHLLYTLVQAKKPKLVIEFGTSFGISTLFLAASTADNGMGKVVSTELIEQKGKEAKANILRANLEDYVDILIGDARETLENSTLENIDFVFLDGEKSMYLEIIRLLELKMAPGCIVVTDNTDHKGAKPFLDYVRDPQNGYISSALMSFGERVNGSGHEISIKL